MDQVKPTLPKIGLGTWQLSPAQAKFSVKKAIEIGYRFIDTAQAYKNEQGVGEALQEVFEIGDLKREDIFLATKVNVFNLKPKKVRKSTEISLQKLKLDSVDLLYVHWPAKLFGYNHKKTLKVFSEFVDEGKVKHIGLSNFSPKLIDEAIEVCDKPIFAIQVENHPLLKQTEMLGYLQEKGIHMISYSPLARGRVFKIPEVLEIAKKHGVSASQVSLAWIISKGAIPIPKATTEDHIRDNFAALSLKLDDDDIQKIDNMVKQKRLLNPPIIKPRW